MKKTLAIAVMLVLCAACTACAADPISFQKYFDQRTGAAPMNGEADYLLVTQGGLVKKTLAKHFVLVNDSGRALINTTTDDGINTLQVNGSIKGARLSLDDAGMKLYFDSMGLVQGGSTTRLATDTNGINALNGITTAAFRVFDPMVGDDGQCLYANSMSGYGKIETKTRLNSYGRTALNPSGGNVLIGTTTDNGTGKLQVNGAISASSAVTSPALSATSYVVIGSTTPPTCTVSEQGQFRYTSGGAGVKDTVQVCAKDASDNYAWRPIY